MLPLGSPLLVPNDPESISGTLQTIESQLFSRYPSKVQFIVRLVLTELMSNAYKHGNQLDVNKWIELTVTAEPPLFTFEVTDQGTGFVLPDFLNETDNVSESGRGLKLIHDLSERFESLNQGRTLKVTLRCIE